MAIAADFDRGTDSAADDRKQEFRRAEVLKLRIAMIAARRMAVLEMRNRDEIGDSVMRKLQIEFDHEEILLRHRYGEESSI
jgi:hypothetical protein